MVELFFIPYGLTICVIPRRKNITVEMIKHCRTQTESHKSLTDVNYYEVSGRWYFMQSRAQKKMVKRFNLNSKGEQHTER